MKTIIILGSTGSVGTQTLDVVRKNREHFTIAALSCHSNIDVLQKQAEEFHVRTVAVYDHERARELRRRSGLKVLDGIEGMMELARLNPVTMLVNALVGSIGIMPTIAAIDAGTDVALANKETLVSAGEIVMGLAGRRGVRIIPVDSEHSAIFQCLNGEDQGGVRRLILTCSGGPFRERGTDDLESVTAAEALRHPRWEMGAKITIDSATLMNKGFEVIEAKMLFDIAYDRIDVVIHPQSIIHSMVEFADRSVLAQLSNPDMRLPIQYALTWPERRESPLAPIDLAGIGDLSFSAPDRTRFPCLDYAVEAGLAGGTMPCVLNAANESAVRAFLGGGIGFMDIPRLIRRMMDGHRPNPAPEIEEIIALDAIIKNETLKLAKSVAALA